MGEWAVTKGDEVIVERLRADTRHRVEAAASLGRGLLTAAAALLLVAILLAGLILVPIAGLGLPILAQALAAVRLLARSHGDWAGRVLGERFVPGYGIALPTDLHKRGRELRWLAALVPIVAVTTLVPAGFVLAAVAIASKPKDPAGRVAEGLAGLLLIGVAWLLLPWLARMQALVTFRLLAEPDRADLAARVAQLTVSRSTAVDAQSAELRRIERDLHDGAQARLVALTMSLGMAEDSIAGDPEQARKLVVEARESATTALAELRDLVRGVMPPVLADRGLPGALEAAALLCPIPVRVAVGIPGRPSPPVESAMYFAAVEALTNIAKHSSATTAWLRLSHEAGVLSLVVGDDGTGGACPDRGTGLAGVWRRLSVFDGALTVSSPAGGPTEILVEVPCGLSSPKITLS